MNKAPAISETTDTAAWPGPNGVHVWTADVAGGAEDVAGVLAMLSPDERARAERLIPDDARRRFILVHGILRRVLAGYLGVAPEAVGFTAAPGGKPGLAGPAADTGLVFSLGHSETWAVVAVGTGSDIGIDVERLGRDRDALMIAKRYFSPSEFAALSRLPLADRDRAFLTCWTRKEAAMKAHGGGMAVLVGIEAGMDTAPEGTVLEIAGQRFTVRDLDGPTGCIGAVARAGEGFDVIQRGAKHHRPKRVELLGIREKMNGP